MKIFFKYLLIASFFVSPLNFASETYQLDPKHTYVLWHGNHFGFSSPSGKWYATGTLVLDAQQPKNSKVSAEIKMDTLDTGMDEFDQHLKDTLFLNVKAYPTANFTSDRVEVTGKNTAKVYGNLTLRGVTKPVVLNVKLNKSGVSPVTNKPTVGFTANTTIKRSEFGMTTLIPGVSDEIILNIEAEAYRDAS